MKIPIFIIRNHFREVISVLKVNHLAPAISKSHLVAKLNFFAVTEVIFTLATQRTKCTPYLISFQGKMHISISVYNKKHSHRK